MHKLCVILSSSYDSPGVPTFFNEEVKEDLAIIKSTLHDHQILEIIIPHTANMSLIMKLIQKNLVLSHLQEQANCHLVLNTHGSPGFSDIKTDCILYLVNLFSQMKISITQISALLCDGMQAPTADPHSQLHVALPDTPKKPFKKEAFLITLQKKLNALVLEQEQHFFIHGFDYAYVPSKDKYNVISLLQGESANPLEVSIRSSTFSEKHVTQIFDKIIDKLKNHERISQTEHQALSNYFAALLNNMKQNIVISLLYHQQISISSKFYPLWDALCTHTKEKKINTNINIDNFDAIYRNWLKTHKIYSSERLNIFSKYSEISSLDKIRSGSYVPN